MNKPLPCPFCGGTPDFANTDERARLRCTECGTESGLFFYSESECESGIGDETERRCIEAWNRRASLPAAEEDGSIDLLPHLRQYQHNDCSGFVFGYDKDGVDRLVARLQAKLVAAEEDARDAAMYRWWKKKRPIALLTSFYGNGCINKTIEGMEADIAAMSQDSKGEGK